MTFIVESISIVNFAVLSNYSSKALYHPGIYMYNVHVVLVNINTGQSRYTSDQGLA